MYLLAIRTSCGKEFETIGVGKEVIHSVETTGMQTAQKKLWKRVRTRYEEFLTVSFKKGKLTLRGAHRLKPVPLSSTRPDNFTWPSDREVQTCCKIGAFARRAQSQGNPESLRRLR